MILLAGDAQPAPTPLDGLLVLQKPPGMSSARCVSRVKRLARELGQKKIGHAGTLDPMAGGVLLILLGQATKIFDHLRLDGEKVYSGALLLGQVTDTWDAEGTVLTTAPWQHVTEAMIEAEAAAWVGEHEQLVPPYSAAKHEGKPLHRLARAGKEVPVKTKTVAISQAQILSVDLPLVKFRVTCGSGTYIRSLAHSLGMRLGCGATLTELTREYSHPFGLSDAHALDAVLNEPERLHERIVPIAACLPDWPGLALNPADEAKARNGMPLPWQPGHDAAQPGEPFAENRKALLISANGTPLALAVTRTLDSRPVWAVLRGLWNT